MADQEEIKISGEATTEQIALWKSQHGDIYKVKCENKVCYLKKVDRKTLSYASSLGTKDPLKFNETILKNCWLGGDEELRDNDDYFLAVSSVISQMIIVKEAELEKL